MRKNTKKPITYEEKMEEWDTLIHFHNNELGKIFNSCLNWLDTYKELMKFYYSCESILEKQSYIETLRNTSIVLYEAKDPLCDAPVSNLPAGRTYMVGVAEVLHPNDIKYSDAKRNKVNTRNLEVILSRNTSTEKVDFEYVCKTGHLYTKYYNIIAGYLKPVFEKKIFSNTDNETIDMESLDIWLVKDGEIDFTINSNLRNFNGYYLNVDGGYIVIINTVKSDYDMMYQFDSDELAAIKAK